MEHKGYEKPRERSKVARYRGGSKGQPRAEKGFPPWMGMGALPSQYTSSCKLCSSGSLPINSACKHRLEGSQQDTWSAGDFNLPRGQARNQTFAPQVYTPAKAPGYTKRIFIHKEKNSRYVNKEYKIKQSKQTVLEKAELIYQTVKHF